ncbi:glycosyltransferase family 2 protein [Parasporobacterium paucivorans]|uniref:Glycosyltransferase involved in cell wall bisynthesis n=1 Tax=Parasporobacterium paucivorans DSM 15970 TaxID=1122934 RepID=A0A1M6E9L4_9FIRM|nr:glycosyltransferase [Parasporobacterium paucivorans]SHI82197.1 Glycosyltransferase involved in cell wall bisynthesis [Parasporobacterium paucivorans DSM 15970]
MKLSVIVPVYNAESFLQKNMMTIVEQLTPETELILVNDGSKDKSADICEQLCQISNNIRVIHKENGGVSSARNKGIIHAQGEYITFVDSDDYVANDYIRTVLSLIKEPIDIVFFGATIVGEDKQINLRPYFEDKQLPDRKGLDDIYTLLFTCRLNEPWDKIYKKSIIETFNISFPLGVNLGEDLIFSLQYITYVRSAKMIGKMIYCHTINPIGLGQSKVTMNTVRYHDLTFSKMLTVLKMLHLSEPHYQESYETMLQIITNCCGKLSKQGYTNKKIYECVKKYGWYSEMMNRQYTSKKSKLRKRLMSWRMYRCISFTFNH